MALYGESTQKRCWTFTADAVRELRSSAREVVIHRVLSQLEAGSDAAAAVDGGDDRDRDVKMRHRESLDGNRCVVLEKVLTEREEMALRWTHEMRIMRICKAYNLPTVVGATAITYFKRFYLRVSVMEFAPFVVALSSLYAALKVEEINVDAAKLVEFVLEREQEFELPQLLQGSVPLSADTILNAELTFLEQIDFHLICYLPYSSLRTAKKELEAFVKNAGACDKLWKAAYDVFNTSVLYSDLILLSTPGKIALALLWFCSCLPHVQEGLEDLDLNGAVRAFCRSTLERSSALSSAASMAEDALLAKEQEIERLVAAINTIDREDVGNRTSKEEAWRLEVKRYAIENKENNPLSEQYQQMRSDEKTKLDHLRREKQKKQREKRDHEFAELLGAPAHSIPEATGSVDMDISVKKRKTLF
ncbi:Cyclin-H1-1 [Porphyridium purpureum]|uniref:Cyclin-H1-1 n=1 Tax=Porphyridium purpureum TaxID=35688 RepID=A0A5J4YL98_PORPP|nr:Cyclin-H1-1 [Porphyridium purpureum]|eukprot:POR3362..scf249_10